MADATDDNAADDARRPASRSVLRWVLIAVYTVLFMVGLFAAIAAAVHFGGFERDFEAFGERVGHEAVAIGMLVVVAIVAYFAARWLITRHRRKTLWSTLGLVVAVLVAWGGWVVHGKWRVADETAKWIAIGGWVGEPPKPESTVGWHDNAAVGYVEAHLRIPDDAAVPRLDEAGRVSVWETVTDDDGWKHQESRVITGVDELTALVLPLEPAVAAAHAAAARPGFEWISVDGQSIESRLSTLRSVLSMHAELCRQLGDADGLSRDAITLLRLSRHLRQRADVIGYIMSMSCARRATDVIAVIDPDRITDAEAMEAELADIDYRQTLADAVVVESSQMTPYLRIDEHGEGRSDEYRELQRLGLMHHDLADWLRRSREAVEAIRADARITASPPGAAGAGLWYIPLTSQWDVVRGGTWNLTGETQLYVNLARVALQLLQHKRAHGAYPDSLEALGEGVPVDPFTGQAFAYQKGGSGFKLTSSNVLGRGSVVWDWTGQAAAAGGDGAGDDAEDN